MSAGFGIDTELPNGLQDADLDTMDLEDAANREAVLKRRGICCHGWSMRDAQGRQVCKLCGKAYATADELFTAAQYTRATGKQY